MQISRNLIYGVFLAFLLTGCFEPYQPGISSKIPGTFRIGTYNLQNLFDDVDDPHKSDDLPPSDVKLAALAQVILDVDCDILAVQEVENIDILNDFNSVYLHDYYTCTVLIEGNDPRGIDVGFLSKFPLENIRSYRDREIFDPDTGNITRFSRDLLAVSWADPSGNPWTFLTTHLKSGRTMEDRHKRVLQGTEIEEICRESGYISIAGAGFTVLLGDLNAEPWAYELAPLMDAPFSDPARDMRNRYTHGSGMILDYILLSPYADRRYIVGSYTIHRDLPSTIASDHFLVYLDLML